MLFKKVFFVRSGSECDGMCRTTIGWEVANILIFQTSLPDNQLLILIRPFSTTFTITALLIQKPAANLSLVLCSERGRILKSVTTNNLS